METTCVGCHRPVTAVAVARGVCAGCGARLDSATLATAGKFPAAPPAESAASASAPPPPLPELPAAALAEVEKLEQTLRLNHTSLPPGWYLIGAQPAATQRSRDELVFDIQRLLASVVA